MRTQRKGDFAGTMPDFPIMPWYKSTPNMVEWMKMAMNIKNSETERLAKELAELTGESLTAAITESVRERLERV
ncbi:MAG TPA: type II toxin-antitoxin system VapB family antitoxin, partial [Bryobacteraceae bacterium]